MTQAQSQEYRVSLEIEIRRILKEDFHHDVPLEVPVRYFLSFKTEGPLAELREALFRLDTGSYGTCVVCHCEIADNYLRHKPAIRWCPRCAQSSDLETVTFHNVP